MPRDIDLTEVDGSRWSTALTEPNSSRTAVPGQAKSQTSITASDFGVTTSLFRLMSVQPFVPTGSFVLPPTAMRRAYTSDELSRVFHQLADKWYGETKFTSSGTELVLHPAYQRIIGLGPAVLPLILGELQEHPSHWFWALQSVSGEDPAPSGADFDGRRQAWLEWGRLKGYIR